MANYQPIVRATVIDIQNDRPKISDRFLVDTNAWYWLTYVRSSQTSRPPKFYQIREYPRYLKSALKSQSELLWSGLSIGELAALIERSEYDIFCQINRLNPQSFSLKEYRHGYIQERINKVISETTIVWDLIRSFGNCLDTIINASTITQTIANLNIQAVDGYDALMVDAMNKAGINQVITDDIDFVTVPGITIFTANRNAIAAAIAQNKLIIR